jgi:hypothetical protein
MTDCNNPLSKLAPRTHAQKCAHRIPQSSKTNLPVSYRLSYRSSPSRLMTASDRQQRKTPHLNYSPNGQMPFKVHNPI